MNESISIIDRGRGLQLSTSRVTVQDLVPYFQDNCSDDEIIHWIPILTAEEIGVVRQYYADHRAALDEQDCRIREQTAEAVQLQRQRFPEPEGTAEERMARLRELLQKRLAERNGADHPG
jgi:uncharacterized protein (DUF433 family)